MSKQVVGIIGGGLMGHGLAYLFAAAGHQVGVYEPDTNSRALLPQRWRQILDLLEDDLRVLDRITVYDRLAPAIADADFVFETVPERLALKQRIFAELETVVSVDTVLASNSSAIPSTQIARDLTYRERVIGTHFWKSATSSAACRSDSEPMDDQ